jgi:hypothetical protein
VILSDPAVAGWLAQAEEAHQDALRLEDPVARRSMLEAASVYQQLAILDMTRIAEAALSRRPDARTR